MTTFITLTGLMPDWWDNLFGTMRKMLRGYSTYAV